MKKKPFEITKILKNTSGNYSHEKKNTVCTPQAWTIILFENNLILMELKKIIKFL